MALPPPVWSHNTAQTKAETYMYMMGLCRAPLTHPLFLQISSRLWRTNSWSQRNRTSDRSTPKHFALAATARYLGDSSRLNLSSPPFSPTSARTAGDATAAWAQPAQNSVVRTSGRRHSPNVLGRLEC